MPEKPKGLRKLYDGDFNYMSQEPQPDGSRIITLTSRKWPGVERFRVRDLSGPNEEVVDTITGESIIEVLEEGK